MEVQACWDHVDRKFDAARFFGDKGAEVIGKLSAQACAPEFPFAMCLATSLLGGCNGATVSAFAGQKTQPNGGKIAPAPAKPWAWVSFAS